MSSSSEILTRTSFAATRTPYVRAGEILLRRGQDRIPDPDFALTRDSEFWDKIEGNATIRAARDFRRHLVAGPRVVLEAQTPPQEHLVPYAQALLARIKGFSTARLGLADAPVRGLVVGRMHGHWEDDLDILGDGNPRRWWILDRIKIQPKGRWELKRWRDPEDGRQRWGWAIWDFGAIAGGEGNGGWRIPEHPEWYLHHLYAAQEGDLYGRDLGRALYWLAHAEHILWESGFDTAERFGAPWILGKLKEPVGGVGPGTGTDVQSYAANADAVLNVLKKLRAHNILVGDERLMDVSLLEASLRGQDIVEKLIERIQQMERILLLGANLPTGPGGGGSFQGSLAAIQDDSTRRLVRYDRELLGETLTDQMLARLLAWNRPALSTIACPEHEGMTLDEVGTPLARILDDEIDDPAQKQFQLSFLQQVPLKVRDADLYALGGFTPPAEGEAATLVKQAAPAGGLFRQAHSPAWLEYADGRMT